MPTATYKMNFKKGKLSKTTLLNLYKRLLRPRMIEDKMLILLRQGKISKWFSGIGQEAIAVGATSALLEDEVVFPMHRNLGVFTTRDVPLERLFCQWQGKSLGFTKGRDRSFHFGTMDYNIVGMISHLGAQLSLAGGVGLAHKLSSEGRISLAFSGEGGTSEGEFHEALNVASVWNLPVIFLVENNGYGLSTPTSEQYACEKIADRGLGYGMKSLTIDGNNILEVYNTVSKLAAEIRDNPHPVLLECMTFRRRGHEEASGTKYVPKELMEMWEAKDPIEHYEQFLVKEGILDVAKIEVLRKEYKAEIEAGLKVAFDESPMESTVENELNDLYAPDSKEVILPSGNKTEKRFIDAISDALRQSMQKHDNLVLMGQDIADYGGVFKITDGFMEAFGRGRVRNTPICESAIVGIGLGLSLKGYKAMVEMQFSDFVTCGFNQIVNNLAKLHYRWGQNADVVIRMPAGGSVGAGPFHSQTNEAWFTHTPGLKVVYPSSPQDAKGLLLASLEDPNPVLFFEHKALYRSLTEEISDEYFTIEIGKAKVVQEGSECSIITYGLGVHWAKEVVEELGVDAEILDLRSLQPIDYEAINQTVQKTNRVIILHEDTLFGGIGGEISAYISEHLFEYLDAPVLRSGSLDTPVPFAKSLEKDYLPVGRFKAALERLIEY
ncbi:MAG: dehydrogenase E1 component subunit alpha/beta [Bacteroidetes bacterium]|nr:dehydrogenase E1 component subunit alpha/beta [Bacteroidota bacterium]